MGKWIPNEEGSLNFKLYESKSHSLIREHLLAWRIHWQAFRRGRNGWKACTIVLPSAQPSVLSALCKSSSSPQSLMFLQILMTITEVLSMCHAGESEIGPSTVPVRGCRLTYSPYIGNES